MSDLNTTFVDSPSTTTPIDAAYLNAVNKRLRSRLPVIDVVEDHGAVVDGTTDDTAAWQAALNAAGAAGGARIISSKRGVSVIAGALQDTTGANCQLKLPSIDAPDSEGVSIVIEGATPAQPTYSVIGTAALPVHGLILKSTLTAGSDGAMIGAKGPTGTYQNFTYVHLVLKNVGFRMPSNPTHSALDLRLVTSLDMDGVMIDAGSYNADGVQPTTATSYGLRTPSNNNGAHTRLGAVGVVGFYNGYEFGEHAVGEQVAAAGCAVAAVFPAVYHASKFQRFMAVHCIKGLTFTGTHYVDVDQFDIEHAASGWNLTTADIDDASNYGHGYVWWHVVKAGVGIDATFTKTGGSSLQVNRMGTALGGSSSLTVQDENANVSTTVTQIDFQGAGVTTTAGTGEVIVTIPGGGSTVYKGRDRLVAAAGNNKLTLGAAPVADSPLVWVNGTIKWPGTDYTISGSVITFLAALSASDVVLVYYDTLTASPTASALTTGSVLPADNFTRADSASALGSTSTGSVAWSVEAGTWGISSNKAYVSSGVASQANRAVVESGLANCTVAATFTVTSTSAQAGLVVRSDGAGNEYVVQVQVDGTSATPQIFKGTAGSYTSIATGASVFVATGSVVSVVLSGSSITVKDDGVTIVSATDSTWSANTKHGMYIVAASGSSSNARIDDFAVTA